MPISQKIADLLNRKPRAYEPSKKELESDREEFSKQTKEEQEEYKTAWTLRDKKLDEDFL